MGRPRCLTRAGRRYWRRRWNFAARSDRSAPGTRDASRVLPLPARASIRPVAVSHSGGFAGRAPPRRDIGDSDADTGSVVELRCLRCGLFYDGFSVLLTREFGLLYCMEF